ncbi:MAG: M3 family oligoendopeptidase [Conexivisphaerales archaeon]
MPDAAGWKLDDLYHDRSDAERDIGNLKDLMARFEEYRNKLESLNRKELESILRMLEKMHKLMDKLGNYAYLRFSEDTANQDASIFLTKINELESELESKTFFFKAWWARLDSRQTSSLEPDSEDFRHYLKLLKKRERYMLGEEAEKAISMKDLTASSGWVKLYEMVVSSFTYRLKLKNSYMKEDGRVKMFSTAELLQYIYSDNRYLRKAAYNSLLGKYRGNANILAEIYSNIVKNWLNEQVRLRHFPRPISARNFINDVSDEAVDALLSVCRENANVFHEYFKVKGKMLGIRMSRYDVYAPLNKKEGRYTFDEAIRFVLRAFNAFDSRFAELAKRVYDSGHIDHIVRQRKYSGAYCASPGVGETPYILMNFNGSMKDIYTLAHESGHAVHSQLASKHSQLTFHSPLVLAETASVFGEMLLYDSFSGNMDAAILSDRISQLYSTIQRQAYISIFEQEAFEMIGDSATYQEVCLTYKQKLREQLGPSVTIPDIFSYEWLYIPHIFKTPFYCYSYAFGNLLALSLFKLYKEEGRSFVPKYLKILSYGGSEEPDKILHEAGIEIESKSLWNNGFRIIREMISALKNMDLN